jgi:hypothetical protein
MRPGRPRRPARLHPRQSPLDRRVALVDSNRNLATDRRPRIAPLLPGKRLPPGCSNPQAGDADHSMPVPTRAPAWNSAGL